MRTHFDRAWYVKRRHVLDSFKLWNSRGAEVNKCVQGTGNCKQQHCIINPENVVVSKKLEEFLGRGPKYCVNVKPSRLDVFSDIQSIARVVDSEEKLAFVEDAVGRMEKLMGNAYPIDRRNFKDVRAVKQELERSSLKLLQTDKTGRFAVLPVQAFQKKSEEALGSLFNEWKGTIGKLRKSICKVFQEESMEEVAKSVLKPLRSTLTLKFFLKDHKIEMPLRTVVNENGTWQKVVSCFLQRGLKLANLEKSIALKNSSELIEVMEKFHGRKCAVFSMDIKDLYYSLEKSRLMNRVRIALEGNLIKFQSGTGIAVDSFLSVLDLYLQSTVLEYEGRNFVQKEGVCIGSSVAPLLAEIYLNTVDQQVYDKVEELSPKCFVKRFVDDILVCSVQEGLDQVLEQVVRSAAPELRFTLERPRGEVLQFLDLRLHLERGLCWEYGKENPKPVLSKSSCHSKNVKAGVVRSLISNALVRSCMHFGPEALKNQWERLVMPGYGEEYIKRQIALQCREKKEKTQEIRNRYAVVPYFHEVSHNLRACAKKYGVDVVFSTDFRLDRLTPFETAQRGCQKAHREKSVPCNVGVVYEVPLACGFKYVGQTSRCLNDRLTEHKRNVKNNAANSELAKHLEECRNCTTDW
ncbi:uncharacterized protein LOC115312851, partial [Ixodes scapularis]|uniref:uncharacterized protein LOC115312851 n=1 Tax=Ixodes scapularis TaxID=6945 RepID=UPI001A9D8438